MSLPIDVTRVAQCGPPLGKCQTEGRLSLGSKVRVLPGAPFFHVYGLRGWPRDATVDNFVEVIRSAMYGLEVGSQEERLDPDPRRPGAL